MPTMVAPTAPGRLAVLDGLRGIAIVLVLMTHSFTTAFRPGFTISGWRISLDPLIFAGSLGVELFFFLSGFVLFMPYVRAHAEGRPLPTLAHYIDRRFIKIVPSYFLALLIIAIYMYQPAEVLRDLPFHLLTHLGFIHNFDHSTMFSINGAFWSIAVEVQFYIFFPLIVPFMLRAPAWTYAAALACGEGYRLWLHQTGANGDFFNICQLPAQIDLFVLGMLSAHIFIRLATHPPSARARSIATTAAVVASTIFIVMLNDFSQRTVHGGYADHQIWQSDHRVFVGLCIAVIALGSLFAHEWWQRILANPVLTWLSVISYNLYLWHEAIITQCEHSGFPCSGSPTPWGTVSNWSPKFFVSYVTISIAVACLVTYLFERPLLRLGTRNAFERAFSLVRKRT